MGTRLRISAAALEVVGPASPEIQLAALPAVLPFFWKENWASPPIVRTAWMTGIVESHDRGVQDRRGLVDRPSRIIQFTSTAVDGAELNAVEMGTSRRNAAKAPAPLVSDVSRTTADSVTLPSSHSEIPCNTRWRRFFIGQRILVVLPSHAPNLLGGARYETITGLDPDRIYIDELPGPVSFPKGTDIYPCMDGEISAGQKITKKSRETGNFDITLSEAPGPGTLPGVWNSKFIDALFPTKNQVPEELPIFDLGHNWADEFKPFLKRGGKRKLSGKGYVFEPSGVRGDWSFPLKLLFENRREFWNLLCFFDWARGATRSFYYVVPSSPWTVQDSGLTTTVRIQTDAAAEDVLAFVPFVSIEIEDSSGIQYYVRQVEGVTSPVPGVLNIDITSEPFLPPWAAVARVRPCYKVRFDKDELGEKWHSDEVCSTQITLVESADEFAYTVADWVPTIPDQGLPDSIGDLTFWFNGQENSFQDDPDANGWMRRSIVFPSRFDSVKFLFDARYSMPDRIDSTKLEDWPWYLRRAGSGTFNPTMVRGTEFWKNRGATMLMNARFDLAAHDLSATPLLTMDQRHLWDNSAGWTLVLCHTGELDVGASAALGFRFQTAAGQPLFEWFLRDHIVASQHFGRARFYSAPGIPYGASAEILPTGMNGYDTAAQTQVGGQPQIIILRWDPNTSATVWVNGIHPDWASKPVNPGPWKATAPPPSLPVATDYSSAILLEQAFDNDRNPARSPVSSLYPADEFFQTSAFFNAMLSYKKALSIADMNSLGQYYQSIQGGFWQDIVAIP